MQRLCILLGVFFIYNHSFSQKATFVVPNNYNEFIKSNDINWAIEGHECYSFLNSQKIDSRNIYDYLLTTIDTTKSPVYKSMDREFSRDQIFDYMIDNSYSEKFTDFESAKEFGDSLKSIKFHEIFFLENFAPKCQLIAASPLTSFAASGISLGLQGLFYCSFQNKYPFKITKGDDVIYLKEFERTINIDSMIDFKIIKETYGMNLTQALWFGASKGHSKIIDTKKNFVIDSANVMRYSILDSIAEKQYDSTGNFSGYYMAPNYPVFENNLTNSIQVDEKIYYNRSKNFFFVTIDSCYLFVKYWNEKTSMPVIEKRFKILFSN